MCTCPSQTLPSPHPSPSNHVCFLRLWVSSCFVSSFVSLLWLPIAILYSSTLSSAPRLTCTDYMRQLPSPWPLMESAHGSPGRRSIRRIREKGEWRGIVPLDPWLGRSFWWSARLARSPQLLSMCAPTFQSPPQPHPSRFLGPGVAAVLLLLALGSCSRLCTFPIPHPHS